MTARGVTAAAGARRYIRVVLRHIQLRRAGRSILRDIDWTICPGERWVLVGANGAGKTQLLKLVAGSVWPTPTGRERRRYLWRGEPRETPFEVQDEIAYVGSERQDRYERYGWNHTVEQIVGTGLYRTDIPLRTLTARDRRTIGALLDRLALRALSGRRFLTLSYGERRLALLARALAARPKLLLLDELLLGLDPVNHSAVLRALARMRRRRLPWVLATHHRDEIPASTTHALVLRRGRIAYRGPVARARLERWLDPPVPRRRRARPPRAEPRPAAPLIRLTHACVFLEGQRVLHDLSLEIARGQCWIVHGPNGSGKSSLLRTLYGDHAVAAGGRIERTGVPLGVPLEVFKRTVGLVAPHLHPPHTGGSSSVLELVESGRYASIGLVEPSRRVDRRAARRALDQFGLGALAARPARELSYGQLRRALFARAWINRPELLLLDEPFAGVDAPTRHTLLEALAGLAQDGTAIVMATHHRHEWPRCTTHELELCAGRSRYRGPVRSTRTADARAARRAPLTGPRAGSIGRP